MHKTICFILFSLFIFSSCQKGSSDESNLIIPGIESHNNNKGNISVIVNSYQFSKDSPSSIDVSGYLIDRDNNLISTVNELAIGGISIDKKVDKKFSSHFSHITHEEDFVNIVRSLTRNSTMLNIKDQKHGEFSLKLPVLPPIKLEFPNNMNGILKKSEGLTVKWNPTINNNLKSDTEQETGVAIIYHAGISKRVNSSLPTENVTLKKTASDALGEVSFSADELSTLPIDGIAIIYIGRGNQTTIEYAEAENLVSYLTYSSSDELVIE